MLDFPLLLTYSTKLADSGSYIWFHNSGDRNHTFTLLEILGQSPRTQHTTQFDSTSLRQDIKLLRSMGSPK